MTTAAVYAELSDAVYTTLPTVTGWSRIGFRPSGQGLLDAFQGVAWRQGREVVVAFKGTSLKRDYWADATLAVGMNITHYALAMKFVESLAIPTATKLSLCGHSLGGAIAQVVGGRMRLPFVTFNAPGVALLSRNLGEVADTLVTGTARIRAAGAAVSAVRHPIQAAQDIAAFFHKTVGANLCLAGEKVSMTGVHYGRVIRVPVSWPVNSVDGLLELHKMESVKKALRARPGIANMTLEQLMG